MLDRMRNVAYIAKESHRDSHQGGLMSTDYSIAEARNRLSQLVHRAEQGEPVRLSRRGKPVAVMVSVRDFERLRGVQVDFWNALIDFRARWEPAFDDAAFAGPRERSPGRRVAL
jgi:prevent-host-death family protein